MWQIIVYKYITLLIHSRPHHRFMAAYVVEPDLLRCFGMRQGLIPLPRFFITLQLESMLVFFLFLPLFVSGMQTKRKISFVFVFAAMVLFMAHAFVPHCYHACHGFAVTAHAHAHACAHHDCPSHDTNETHFCHAHHMHDNGDDCLLNKPFLRSSDCSVKSTCDQPTHRPLFLDFTLPTLCSPTTTLLAIATNAFPDPPANERTALWVSTQGLRAPPAQ